MLGTCPKSKICQKLMPVAAGFAAVTAFGLLSASASHAQSPPVAGGPSTSAGPMKFEVASVKRSQAPDGRGVIRPAPGGERYVATNVTLKLMIMVAYRVKGTQITGGPAWINNDRFDMNAKAERPSTPAELHLMLQDLLADQFKLRFHPETKELPVYVLTVDKGGPKLQPHQAQSAGDPWIDAAFVPPKMTWHATFAPMAYFAWRLSVQMDRPVIDRTNLVGGYDFDLAFTPELRSDTAALGGPAKGAEMDNPGPTIFDAVRDQLGLKLERQKGPVEIMVIDRVEKPEGN